MARMLFDPLDPKDKPAVRKKTVGNKTIVQISPVIDASDVYYIRVAIADAGLLPDEFEGTNVYLIDDKGEGPIYRVNIMQQTKKGLSVHASFIVERTQKNEFVFTPSLDDEPRKAKVFSS